MLVSLKSKVEDKLFRCFQANEGLYEEFQDIIDNSPTVEEFEMLWKQMIDRYQLQGMK
jgi:hypothetical protein